MSLEKVIPRWLDLAMENLIFPGPRKIGTSQTQFTNAKAPGIETPFSFSLSLYLSVPFSRL